jgi:uncharacterized repeat protein (TIGR03803 family)
MTTKIQYSLLVVLILSSAFCSAQTYKVLYSFDYTVANGDGAVPTGNLASDHAGNLYGTTEYGGNSICDGCGTVFELSPNGDGTWSESVLYRFCNTVLNSYCTDGAQPQGGLIIDAQGNLYGATTLGGTASGCGQGGGCGIVFELSPPAAPGADWIETVLYNFCSNLVNNFCADGYTPLGKLTLDASGNLYGTTSQGGTHGGGTIYELSPAITGWNYTNLYSFCTETAGKSCLDGSQPLAGVTFDASGNLYGTTEYGGAKFGGGTVYKLTPGSGGWTENVLLTFRTPYNQGAAPMSGVSFDASGNLYGTNSQGGIGGSGTVFKLSFNGRSGTFRFNGGDGSKPVANVILDSRTGSLYGTASNGGANSGGTIFKIGPSGKQTVLYNFCSQSNCADGGLPEGNLLYHAGPVLYGTASGGGANGFGVVYQITP